MSNCDFYEMAGGDAAWQKWLDLCSVARVRDVDGAMADGLARQIAASVQNGLKKIGFGETSAETSVLVHHFDTYFLLQGAEKKGRKPLKQWLRNEMDAETSPLKKMVCGKLFGERGIVFNIARDYVETVKGWKPHSITRNGKRKVVWEGACAEEDARDWSSGSVSVNAGARLDAAFVRHAVAEALNDLAVEIKVEKRAVALLFYVTAYEISIDTPTVLAVLGVAKSRAYGLKGLCMKKAEKIFLKHEIAMGDFKVGEQLLRACRTILGDDLVKALSQNQEEE